MAMKTIPLNISQRDVMTRALFPMNISTAATAGPSSHSATDVLSDFKTDRRVLLLCALALPIGAIGSVVAKVLLWLIAVFTNAAFFQRFSAAAVSPQDAHLGAWVIVVPALGALVIGLMARY